MSWVKTDDRYDDTRKIKRAWRRHPRAVGLHAMSKSYCARHETDGLVDLDWLEDRLPDETEREQVIAVMVDVDLYELLPAGETKRVKVRDVTVRYGPLNEVAYIVHDYLEFNEAKCEAEDRRQKDAQRKSEAREARRNGQRPASAQSPPGVQADTNGTPDGIQAVSALSRPDPTRPDPTPTNSTMPPSPPTGGRKRDQDHYEKQMQAWVARHLPEHPVKAAVGYTRHAVATGKATTVEEIVAYVHRCHRVGAVA